MGGQLVGASNVNVGGDLYDVQFMDGTCIALFSGCDAAADLPFATQSAALAASQALLGQVFIDGPDGPFDSNPGLTAGCSDAFQCIVNSPYLVFAEVVLTGAAVNTTGGDFTTQAYSFDTGDDMISGVEGPLFTYAIWTAVPEYATRQVPFFERPGTRPELKRHVVWDSGHFGFPIGEFLRENRDWLDRCRAPRRTDMPSTARSWSSCVRE